MQPASSREVPAADIEKLRDIELAARDFTEEYVRRVHDEDGPFPPVFPMARFGKLMDVLGIKE